MLGLGEKNVTEYKLLERECHHNRANDKMGLMLTPSSVEVIYISHV